MSRDDASDHEIIIRPASGWLTFDYKEAWRHRDLLFFLIRREISGIYRQTILGPAWALISPILMLIIYSFVFGIILKVNSGEAPYPVFLVAGLMPWQFVQNASIEATFSLVRHIQLIQKVYIPRIYLPLVAVGVRLVHLLMALLILVVVVLIYGVVPPWQIVFLPLLLVHTVVLASALGLLFAGFNARYRDVGFGLPFLLQMMMYLSPVVYPSSSVPENIRLFYSFNPVVGLIDGFRSCVLGTPWNLQALAISLVVTLVLIVASIHIFRRAEAMIADVV